MSSSPQDGFWYDIDNKLEAQLIVFSLLIAISVGITPHYVFRGIDVSSIKPPWVMTILAFYWSLSASKRRVLAEW